MNLDQLLDTSRKNKELHASTSTRINGYTLYFARIVWLTLFCLIVLVFLLGIPNTFKIALTLQPETVAGLKQLGLQANFPAIYIIALDTFMKLVFACFAALIVWRRPDDWMIMFVSLALLSTAMLYTAPAFEAEVPLLLLAFLASFAEICQITIVYLFPDGRFVPRWMWVLLLHGFTGGSELAIVGSTLTTAILFQPLRRHIQQLIDRRFYRSNYDTVRSIASFGEAMSEEVDLTQLTEQLLSVVQETMHPTFVSLWIRKSENQQNKRVTRVLPKIGDQIDVY